MMEESKATKQQAKKNLWKSEEDLILRNYVETHGEGNWATVSQESGKRKITSKLSIIDRDQIRTQTFLHRLLFIFHITLTQTVRQRCPVFFFFFFFPFMWCMCVCVPNLVSQV